MQCIYGIIHKLSQKIYVGSAVCVSTRWADHKRELRKQKHYNLHLQAYWNKYGANAFEFRVLEEVSDKSKLIEREQFWMDHFKSWDSKFGYNILPIAGSSLGHKHTRETIARMRKARLENPVLRYMDLNKHISTEQRHQISQALVGHLTPKIVRNKISARLQNNQNPVGCHRSTDSIHKQMNHPNNSIEKIRKRNQLSWTSERRRASSLYMKESWKRRKSSANN